MKHLIRTTIVAALFQLCACNGNSSTADTKESNSTADASNAATMSPPSEDKQCYAQMNANDTLQLTVVRTGDDVTGTLDISRSGKDSNNGTFEGTMKGDTLVALYRFGSEGKHSLRQIAFLKKGDAFIEGFGPVEMKGDTTVFKNTSALTFNDNMKLEKHSCQ